MKILKIAAFIALMTGALYGFMNQGEESQFAAAFLISVSLIVLLVISVIERAM